MSRDKYKNRSRVRTFAVMMPLAAIPFSTSLAARAEDNPPTSSEANSEPKVPEITVTGYQESAPEGYKAPTSTVGGGKIETAVRDIPQSVTVINRALMDAQGTASLTDALRNVPGITIGGAEGGQIGTNINLRGFTARTDMYLDGMRDRGQYYRDTYYLNAVEVLKGPSSMFFGRGSTGGVVNQVRKKPLLSNRNEVSTTFGTEGYYRGTADFNRQISTTTAARLAVMGQDISTTRDVMENKDYGAAPSVRFGIGTPTEVEVSALISHNNDMPDYGVPSMNGKPVKVSFDNYYGLSDDRTVQDVTVVNATVKHDFNPYISVRNALQYGHYITDARETSFGRLGTFNAATGEFTQLEGQQTGYFTNLPISALSATLISHDRKISDTAIYDQADLIGRFATGWIRHTTIVGAEIGHDTFDNTNFGRKNPAIIGVPPLSVTATTVAVVDLEEPDSLPGPPGSITSLGNVVHADADTLAFYGNDTLELSKQLKAIIGVRWDRFRSDISNSFNSTNTAGNLAPARASQTDDYTSVRTGLLYQPTNVQSYYFSFGTSFNPSLETLALTNGTQNLDPEKSRSFELGSKWDFMNGNLSVNTALFRIEKTNARSQIDPGVFQVDGEVRVDGVEAAVTGYLNPRWQLMAGYTFLDSKIVKASELEATTGNDLPNTPDHTILLWSTYAVTPIWEVGGGATYLSSVFTNNTNFVDVPGYVRLDATVAFHQPRYDVRLNLLNLLDKNYYASVIPSDGGRSIPGVGITALGTFTFRF